LILLKKLQIVQDFFYPIIANTKKHTGALKGKDFLFFKHVLHHFFSHVGKHRKAKFTLEVGIIIKLKKKKTSHLQQMVILLLLSNYIQRISSQT
jgi:hypothetical protein